MTPAAARQLGSVLEPLVGQVHFAPECHQAYECNRDVVVPAAATTEGDGT